MTIIAFRSVATATGARVAGGDSAANQQGFGQAAFDAEHCQALLQWYWLREPAEEVLLPSARGEQRPALR